MSSGSEIDASSLSLFHRTSEVKCLTDAFDRVYQSAQSEVLIVSGKEGVGKTAIIEKGLRDYVVNEKNCYLVIGKFDGRRRDPFGPIIHAFTDLLDLLGQNNRSQTAEAFQYGIAESEQRDLVKLLGSSFRGFLKQPQRFDSTYEQFTLNRLKVLFRSLLKAIATIGIPITIVFDELQYANKWAMDLVLFFLTRKRLQHILFLCAHRDLSGSITNLIQLAGLQHLPITDVHIQELDVNGVNEIVSSILDDQDPQSTKQLSDLVYRRTHGNCRFVLEFIQQLTHDDLIEFDENAPPGHHWSWCLNRMTRETSICEYVLEQTKRRLHAQPHGFKEVLSIASLQGLFQFNAELLFVIIQELDSSRDCKAILFDAIKLGIIEPISDVHYQFTHGNIYQILKNSFDALPEGERAALHYRIGQIIKKHLNSFKSDEVLLQAVDHLNLGSRFTEGNLSELIGMNMRAGELASKSSQHQAADYLKKARNLATDKIWSTNSKLAAELYIASAECEFKAGDFEECNNLSYVVLLSSQDIHVRCKALFLQQSVIASRGQFKEAFLAAIEIINQGTNEKFPAFPSDEELWSAQTQTHRELSVVNETSILKLPRQTDANLIALMKMLSFVALNAFFDGRHPEVMVFAVLRLVSLTLLHGLSMEAPFVFACYASVAASCGNMKDTRRYGELAMKMLEQQNCHVDVKARTLSILGQCVSHWSNPISTCSNMLVKCSEMLAGVNDEAASFFGSFASSKLAFYSGENLHELHQDLQETSEQLKYFNKSSLAELEEPFMQLVSNLMGDSIRGTQPILGPEIIGNIREANRQENTVLGREIGMNALMCATFFENWEVAAAILSEINDDFKPIKSHYSHLFDSIFIGAACYELYRITGDEKFLARATTRLNLMKGLANEGCKNCEGPSLFLEAMNLSIVSGQDAGPAVKAFSGAIDFAQHNEAIVLGLIAYQRGADHMQRNHRIVESHIYIDEAISICKDWSADELSSHIMKKYCDPTEKATSSSESDISVRSDAAEDPVSGDEAMHSDDSITCDSYYSDSPDGMVGKEKNTKTKKMTE